MKNSQMMVLHRAIVTLQLLGKGGKVTSKTIQDHLFHSGHDVHLRTVQRLLDDLKALGVISFYQAPRTSFAPRVCLYSLNDRSPVRAMV